MRKVLRVDVRVVTAAFVCVRGDRIDPEARNAKVRHDDALSTTTSLTSTTSTTPTPDERLLRLLRLRRLLPLRTEDDGLESEVSPIRRVNPNPNPYMPYIYPYLIKSCINY